MKPKPLLLISRLMSVATLVAVSSPAFAGSLIWDGNGSTAPNPNGGAGIWDTNSTVSWWNGSANAKWPAAGGTDDDAVFANTAGAVTVATVTANDLTFSTDGYTLSGGTLTLNGLTPTVNTAGSVTAAIGSPIAGTVGLAKTGAGSLILNGAVGNTYTGNTTLSVGQMGLQKTSGVVSVGGDMVMASTGTGGNRSILWATQDNQFGVNSVLRFSGSGDTRLELKGTTQTFAGLESSAFTSGGAFIQHSEFGSGAAVDATSALIVNVSGSNSYTFGHSTAVIRDYNGGILSLTKNGTGTQTFIGGNTYSGATTVNAGTLRIGNGTGVGSIASNSAVTVATGATIEWFHSTGGYTIGNPISGSGQLKLQGTNATNALHQGFYMFTGNNSGFSGELVLNRALSWNNTSAAQLGTGTIRIQDRATLAVNGGITANNTIIIENGAGWHHSQGGDVVIGAIRMEGTNTLAGNLQLNHNTGVTLGDNTGANSTLGSWGAANNTFSGVISGTGELSMSRFTSWNGGGPQTVNYDLSGTASNTYTGKTVVDGQGAVANLRLMKTGGAVAIPGGNVVQLGSATGGQANLRMGDTSATGATRSQWNNQFGTTSGGVLLNFVNGSGQWMRFDLQGTQQSVAGLNAGNLTTQGGAVIQNQNLQAFDPGQDGTLSLIGADAYIFNGYLRDQDNGGNTRKIHLVKSGSGTQTLVGNAIDYTGTTTVSAGRLVFANNDDYWTSAITIGSGAVLEVAKDSAFVGRCLSFQGAGTFVKSGAGTMDWSTNTGSAVNFGSGSKIDIQGGVVRLAYGGLVNFANNKADLNVATGATFNTWDANTEVRVDALTGSGTVTRGFTPDVSTGNTGNGTLVVGIDNGSGVFDGVIADNVNNTGATLHLAKRGTGTQTLTGTNTFRGTTTISGGTLALSGGSALPNTGVVNIDAGAQLTLNANETIGSLTSGATGGNVNLQGNTLTLATNASDSFAGSFSGTGGLIKTGTGTLTLSGTSIHSHSGATSINSGTLNLTGTLADSLLTIADGAVVSGEGSAASMVLGTSGGADLIIDPNTPAALSAGTLSINGQTFVRLNGAIPQGTLVEIPIITFNAKGNPASNGWNSSSFKLIGGNGTYRTPSFIVGTNNVILKVGGKKSLGWGVAYEEFGAIWEKGGSGYPAFYDEAGEEDFFSGDDVTFDDYPLAYLDIVHQAIDIPETVTPGNVTVDVRAAHHYTFTGQGIAGAGSLTKKGSGTLTLNDITNTYSGATTILGGSVEINHDASLGTAPAVPTPGHLTFNGGTLKWTGNFTLNANRGIAIGSNGGTLDTTAASNTVDFASPVTGSGLLTLHQANNGNATISGNMSGFTGQFRNEGGNVRIPTPDANWAATDFSQNAASGWLELNGGGTAIVKSISSMNDVKVNNGTRLNVGVISMATNNHSWKSDTGAPGELTTSSGTLTVTNGSATGNLETLDHQIQLRLADFNGSTPLALVKNGVNQLAINQANTFSGGTTIYGGRIQADHLQAFGSGQVTVNPSGQALLSTPGTYANAFTIAGNGTMETGGALGAIRFNSNVVVAGSVTVSGAGARMTAPNGAVNILTGALLGSGNLEINSSAAGSNSTLNLNGNCSGYNGSVTVSQGRLNLNVATFGGSVVSSDNTTLSGEATVAGTVTLGSTGGSTLVIDASSPAALTSTGAMAVKGTATVSLSGTVPAGTPIKVAGFGSKSGSWNATNFALSGAANYRAGAVFSESSNAVTLTIPAFDLVWNNAVGTLIWGSGTTADANFQNQKFFWGDRVTFGDLPAAAQNITVSGSVQPAAMTVDSQYAYTFAGGSIDGGSTLVKSGTGILTLNQANTFTGGTTVNGGTLKLTVGGAVGTIRGAVTVNSNGTLLLQNDNVLGSSTGSKVNVINLNGGTVTHAGTGDNGWGVAYNLTGGTLQSTGTGRFAFGGNTAVTTLASAVPATIAGKIQLRENNNDDNVNFTSADGAAAKDLVVSAVISETDAERSITKIGAGTMELSGANTYSGTTTVNGGTLLANNTTGSATGTGAVVVNEDASFGGTGSVTGSVTINTGGMLATDGVIESLATGSLTLAPGSSCQMECKSTGTPSADVIHVTGDVTLAGSFNLTDLAATQTAISAGTKLPLMTYTGTLTGAFDGIADGDTVICGSQSFKIRYADGNAVTLEATTFAGSDPFISWAASAGLDGTPGKENGYMDDPDHDGRSNLLEFYLDGNPLANDPSKQPATTLNATYLTLTFKRRDDAEATVANQAIAYGSNLTAWSEAVIGATSSTSNGVIVTIVENDTAPDDITVQIPRSLASGGKLFARLKVSK